MTNFPKDWKFSEFYPMTVESKCDASIKSASFGECLLEIKRVKGKFCANLSFNDVVYFASFCMNSEEDAIRSVEEAAISVKMAKRSKK